MISIKTIDLDNLEQIGSGRYGIVYQASDTIAYKVYKDTVLGFRGHPESNPALYRSFLFFMKVK